jgi:hypothetical protein
MVLTSMSLVEGVVQSWEIFKTDSVSDQEFGVESAVFEVLHDLFPERLASCETSVK